MRRTVIAAIAASLVVASTGSAAASPTLDWTPCADTPPEHPARCVTVSVPLDWARPLAGQTRVHVARRPAGNPAQRIGVLMFNPGGPGASAADIAAKPGWAEFYFPKSVLDSFDLVGVDPRGVGGSAAIECALPAKDPAISRFPSTVGAALRLSTSNTAFGLSCKAGARLDTETVARDLDLVRAALGESKISFLGISYGTMLAQSYAELFPTRLRALALDGIVDRTRDAARLALDSSSAVEDAVEQFAGWCARQENPCPLPNRDARAAITRVLDGAPYTVDSRTVTAEEIQSAAVGALSFSAGPPALAAGLAAALDKRDPSGLVPVSDPAQYARYRAIVCQDVPWTHLTPRGLVGMAGQVRASGPTLRGASEFWDIASGCAGWPVPARWRPHPWRPSADLPTTLMLSGAHDVSTPRPWAESVHRQLPDSRLLHWDGLGHAAWSGNNPCAMRAAADYLLTLNLPAEGTTCPAR